MHTHTHKHTLSLSFPPSQLISIHDAFLPSCSLVFFLLLFFALALTVSHRNTVSETEGGGKLHGDIYEEWKEEKREDKDAYAWRGCLVMYLIGQ